MSLTISAIPFLLIAAVVKASIDCNTARGDAKTFNDLNSLISGVQKNPSSLNQEAVSFICQEYQTVFLDKETLVKTLKEHGLDEISILENEITCRIEGYRLKFTRENSEPYKLSITCPSTGNTEETMLELDGEYAKNVQEATYMKIKERLAKNNLKIDNEEILEDDSIVLTVNLD